MIDHSNCDHPATSSARAKCRRAHRNGGEVKTKSRDTRRGDPTGRPATPNDKADACDICGVERIVAKGTPPLEKRLLFVGAKCAYYLNDAPDITPLD